MSGLRRGAQSALMLQVLRQSYFFDSAVKHMGVSQTMHGISNKFLLVGTLSDQVGNHCIAYCPPAAAHFLRLALIRIGISAD